jgi:hypothetical protein
MCFTQNPAKGIDDEQYTKGQTRNLLQKKPAFGVQIESYLAFDFEFRKTSKHLLH